jgi:hypothetical protein
VARATGAPLHSDGFGLEARGWLARVERWFTGRNSSEVDDITDAAWRAQEEGTTEACFDGGPGWCDIGEEVMPWSLVAMAAQSLSSSEQSGDGGVSSFENMMPA